MSKIPIDLTFTKRNIQGFSFSKTVSSKYVKFMSMLTGLKDIGLRLVFNFNRDTKRLFINSVTRQVIAAIK